MEYFSGENVRLEYLEEKEEAFVIQNWKLGVYKPVHGKWRMLRSIHKDIL